MATHSFISAEFLLVDPTAPCEEQQIKPELLPAQTGGVELYKCDDTLLTDTDRLVTCDILFDETGAVRPELVNSELIIRRDGGTVSTNARSLNFKGDSISVTNDGLQNITVAYDTVVVTGYKLDVDSSENVGVLLLDPTAARGAGAPVVSLSPITTLNAGAHMVTVEAVVKAKGVGVDCVIAGHGQEALQLEYSFNGGRFRPITGANFAGPSFANINDTVVHFSISEFIADLPAGEITIDIRASYRTELDTVLDTYTADIIVTVSTIATSTIA